MCIIYTFKYVQYYIFINDHSFFLMSVLYSLIAHVHLVSFGTGRSIALTTCSFHKEDRNHNLKTLKPLHLLFSEPWLDVHWTLPLHPGRVSEVTPNWSELYFSWRSDGQTYKVNTVGIVLSTSEFRVRLCFTQWCSGDDLLHISSTLQVPAEDWDTIW